jgi:predicted membrane protein
MLAGISIIAFGVLALLGGLDIINFGTFFGVYWPLVLIWIGFLSFLSNPRDFGWPLILIFAGFLLQLRELELLNFNVWHLIWPTAVIVVGVSVLFRHGYTKAKNSTSKTESATAFMSGYTLKNQSDDYQGGSVSSFMGGIKLDLTKATIKKEAVLDVSVVMGGVELLVPENWSVKTKVTPIMGGVENRAAEVNDKNAPTLTIVGTLVMGGIDIKR